MIYMQYSLNRCYGLLRDLSEAKELPSVNKTLLGESASYLWAIYSQICSTKVEKLYMQDAIFGSRLVVHKW